MKDKETIHIDDMISNANTGDIILFHSKEKWYDFIIEYFSKSKYTHIGIIINQKDITDISLEYIKDTKDTSLLFLESGKENVKDIIDNKKIYGVQCILLKDIIKEYNNTNKGTLYYRKLDCKREHTFKNTLSNIIKKVYDKPYDLIPFDWIKSYFHFENIGNTEKTNTFWCSALVTYIYDKLGFIKSFDNKNNIPWTIIQPKQFSYYENEDNKKFIFQYSQDIYLYPEQKILF